MMEWLNYLLKVSACSVLFFAFYLLVLRRLTFFKINRFYLLFTLGLSFIIPTLQFTIEREVAAIPVQEVINIAQSETGITSNLPSPMAVDHPSATPQPDFDWQALLPFLYGAIVIIFLGIAIWRLFQLVHHARLSTQEINGLKLVSKNQGFTNCSFFNYVFINDHNLTATELDVLLQHEEVHVKQLHSIDKLILMLAKSILWFNPVIYLWDKALEEVHEFEADQTVSDAVGAQNYANLLLNLVMSKSTMPLIHNFVKSPIKQRIKMLFHSKSKNMKKLIYLLMLPIGLGLLWGFTVDVVDVFPKTINDEKPFTLILDAGHGGNQSGIEVNGYKEKDITLAIAKKIKTLAEAKGINVVMTRNGDENITLADRAKFEGTYLLSLHVNSEPAKYKGMRNGIEFFTAMSDRGLIAAKSNSMTYYLSQNLKTVKGIKTADEPRQSRLLLLQQSSAPGVVVELGYLTNNNDLKILTNEDKQTELAKAIVDGILVYKEKTPGDEQFDLRGKARIDSSLLRKNGQKGLNQQKPFIRRMPVTFDNGKKGENISVWVRGKAVSNIYTTSNSGTVKMVFYINGKIYSETEALKFDNSFIAKLSTVNGSGSTKTEYKLPGIEASRDTYVIWFGTEPPLTESMAKNRSYYQKYNGKTISGKITDYTYSSNKLSGFIVKTSSGESVQADVEAKFSNQIASMINKGDEVSLKIYNSRYLENIPYPVIVSYKLMKNNKVMFDRWPKTAAIVTPKTLSMILKSDDVTIKSDNIYYAAKDSTRVKKDNVYLFGEAELSNKDYTYHGESMIYNKKDNTLRINKATLFDKKENITIKADSAHLNLDSKKGILFGTVLKTN